MSYEDELRQLAEVISNPDYVTYCSLEMRVGVRAWMTEIEYTKFRPATLDNDDFHLAIMKWPDGDISLRYLLIIFHRSAQQFAESILWRNGLKKMPEGFTQMIIGGKEGKQEFPLQGPTIFWLENHTQGAPNVVYSNDPVKMKAARELEDAQCQVFYDSQAEWLETEEGKAKLAEFLKKHPEGENQ